MKIHLGPATDIPPDGAHEYSLDTPELKLEVFVINEQGRYFAYRNSCPHTGINLNWQPDQFFSLDNLHIQCSVHGALFRKTDGFCEWGPCVGQFLKAYTVENVNGQLMLDIDNA